ncbi:cupredoxin domain-containing protein [Massilia endophytica]|uniref:cupredoxin domain-containing protein n=1 Tax=Massilia endophytica TaxID=2899220 RepID=UPI001E2AB632|nr:cupredoxin family copper-binding protein [Massilia endophytica]UGQ47125.1 cupredoxin family copper-binding protein [Massilia endophytica]
MTFRMKAAVAAAATLLAGAALAAPAVHIVLIDGMQFIPQTLEVKPGDTVIWRNKDPFPHNVTADAKGGPASPAIAAEASWKFTAEKRGSYPYVCTLHRMMKGTLVVK